MWAVVQSAVVHVHAAVVGEETTADLLNKVPVDDPAAAAIAEISRRLASQGIDLESTRHRAAAAAAAHAKEAAQYEATFRSQAEQVHSLQAENNRLARLGGGDEGTARQEVASLREQLADARDRQNALELDRTALQAHLEQLKQAPSPQRDALTPQHGPDRLHLGLTP